MCTHRAESIHLRVGAFLMQDQSVFRSTILNLYIIWATIDTVIEWTMPGGMLQ